jgi:hypothetical protein
MNLYIESCKCNPDVRWRFFTDCGEPENKAPNVDYVHLSFADYKALTEPSASAMRCARRTAGG